MDPKLRWDGDKNIGHVAISVRHNPGTRQELGPWTASFSSTADMGGGPVNFVDPVHGWATGEFHLYQMVDGPHRQDRGGGHR